MISEYRLCIFGFCFGVKYDVRLSVSGYPKIVFWIFGFSCGVKYDIRILVFGYSDFGFAIFEYRLECASGHSSCKNTIFGYGLEYVLGHSSFENTISKYRFECGVGYSSFVFGYPGSYLKISEYASESVFDYDDVQHTPRYKAGGHYIGGVY